MCCELGWFRMRNRRGYKLLREREREVALSRTAHEKEWGKERDQFRKAEAQEVFKAYDNNHEELFTEYVKSLGRVMIL